MSLLPVAVALLFTPLALGDHTAPILLEESGEGGGAVAIRFQLDEGDWIRGEIVHCHAAWGSHSETMYFDEERQLVRWGPGGGARSRHGAAIAVGVGEARIEEEPLGPPAATSGCAVPGKPEFNTPGIHTLVMYAAGDSGQWRWEVRGQGVTILAVTTGDAFYFNARDTEGASVDIWQRPPALLGSVGTGAGAGAVTLRAEGALVGTMTGAVSAVSGPGGLRACPCHFPESDAIGPAITPWGPGEYTFLSGSASPGLNALGLELAGADIEWP